MEYGNHESKDRTEKGAAIDAISMSVIQDNSFDDAL